MKRRHIASRDVGGKDPYPGLRAQSLLTAVERVRQADHIQWFTFIPPSALVSSFCSSSLTFHSSCLGIRRDRLSRRSQNSNDPQPRLPYDKQERERERDRTKKYDKRSPQFLFKCCTLLRSCFLMISPICLDIQFV